MAETTEQWFSNGNCELCRRKKYCSKQCKANKGFIMRHAIQIGAAMAAQILSAEQERQSEQSTSDTNNGEQE